MMINESLQSYRHRVDQALQQWLSFPGLSMANLAEALNYAVFNGGKRMRAFLVYATGLAFSTPPTYLDNAACAIELIHAYSLVHDDLPAMDNSDLRRGLATCHKAYDEATAILVGDALHSLAFEVLAQPMGVNFNNNLHLQMITTLARAAGYYGMAGGQALDLASTQQPPQTISQLETLHLYKTGALIRAAVRMGALASQITDTTILEQLDEYARCLGLAFQIQDDILDVESDTLTLGKPQYSDIRNQKVTYPQLLGLAGAKQQATTCIEQALAHLDTLTLDNKTLLVCLAKQAIHRTR